MLIQNKLLNSEARNGCIAFLKLYVEKTNDFLEKHIKVTFYR